ncbi:hypothetical protein LOTGIDRAFT_235984 [Lottia gigantea]|uniref:Macrophage-expressed gene 1 protein n=1 Tax=Lottia gigantea TaxID=225164 RepID=V3ZQY4_LOTGI|nr:hypothetical protein LOTGIDRAFT_235984 [Lottia gigantea]ESO84925.1 hypothetical protein LOTGIDRAFT_235984 [Lottia gigantea]
MLKFLIAFSIISIAAAVDSPDGDPVLRMDSRVYKRCIEDSNNEVAKFDVLPIYGWDNLRNKYGGMVIEPSITAGAALVQEDFVTRQFMAQNENQKRTILASASANFFNIVHASFSRSSTVSSSTKQSYEKSITSSQIMAYGGSVFTFQDYSVNKWAEKLDKNLVAMDRAGEPLHLLITHENLPEIPTFLAHQVKQHVYDAIWKYYEYNIYRGCMNLDSPNFSYIANVDDESCEAAASNLTFGGVYQMCTMTRRDAGDLCGKLSQENPKTGKFSCPANYQAVKLYTEDYKRSTPYRNCRKCGWWSRCCSSGTRRSYATLTVYWCVALKPVPRNSGYLFGGVYSSRVDNPVTMDNSCPDTYISRMIGSDLYVCLSDDFELGNRLSLPFGGFFSCNSGNPLAGATPSTPGNNKQGPKECPKGYSQHLAIISQECSVYYCAASGSFSVNGPAPIQRPPFSEEPQYVPDNEQFVFYNLNTSKWEMARDEETMEKMKPETSKLIARSLSTVPALNLVLTIFTAAIVIVIL